VNPDKDEGNRREEAEMKRERGEERGESEEEI
jgi:hypothetical protein